MGNIPFSKEELQVIIDKYPRHGAEEMERLIPGRNYRTIMSKAQKMGIKKLPGFRASKSGYKHKKSTHSILVDEFIIYAKNLIPACYIYRIIGISSGSYFKRLITHDIPRPKKVINSFDMRVDFDVEKAKDLTKYKSIVQKILDRSKELKHVKVSKELPKFKTKTIDHKSLVPVVINSKTTVYVKPGTNADKVRAKYSNKSL